MIKKTLATVMMMSALSLSSMSFAATLQQNMQALGKNYKAFNQTTNPAEANKALDNMRAAATDAKKLN
jgi:soluble cytochrome b562